MANWYMKSRTECALFDSWKEAFESSLDYPGLHFLNIEIEQPKEKELTEEEEEQEENVKDDADEFPITGYIISANFPITGLKKSYKLPEFEEAFAKWVKDNNAERSVTFQKEILELVNQQFRNHAMSKAL